MRLFINYRRDDTDDLAGRLHDRLSTEFGTENIFKDVDSIRPGQNWKTVLENSVSRCDVVLALIGKQWLNCLDSKGMRRILHEDDWVRFELEVAHRQQRLVLPILAKGARVPQSEELPASLRWLPEIHVIEVRGDPFFRDDVARLIAELKRLRDRLAEQASATIARNATAGEQLSGSGSAAIVCQRCSKSSPSSYQFCEFCGTALWENCPKCETRIPVGQRFCNGCGADVTATRRADQVIAELRSRFNDAAGQTDEVARLRLLDTLWIELDTHYAGLSTDDRILSLKRQTRELLCETIRDNAVAATKNRRLSAALALLQRILVLSPNDSFAQKEAQKILDSRDGQRKAAAEAASNGNYRAAADLLNSLVNSFPDDSEVREEFERLAAIAERSESLFEGELRSLKSQRRLFQLDKELAWLKSQGLADAGVEKLATAVRKALDVADNHVARAQAAKLQGNVLQAETIARKVLESVADHHGALEIISVANSCKENVAQLTEFVRLQKWMQARSAIRRLKELGLSDPQLAKYDAQINAAVSELDFHIWVLAIEIVATALAWWLLAPWLTKFLPAIVVGVDQFYHYVVLAGGAILVIVTWLVIPRKSEVVQRLAMLLGLRRDFLKTATTSRPAASGRFKSIDDPFSKSTVMPLDPPARDESGTQSATKSAPALVNSAGEPIGVIRQPQVAATRWVVGSALLLYLGSWLFSWLPEFKSKWLEIALQPTAIVLSLLVLGFVLGRRHNRLSIAVAAFLHWILLLLFSWLANDFAAFAAAVVLLSLACSMAAAVVGASWKLSLASLGSLLLSIFFWLPTALVVWVGISLLADLNADNYPPFWLQTAIASTVGIWGLLLVWLGSPSATWVRHFVADIAWLKAAIAVALALSTVTLAFGIATAGVSLLPTGIQLWAALPVCVLLLNFVVPLLQWNWRSAIRWERFLGPILLMAACLCGSIWHAPSMAATSSWVMATLGALTYLGVSGVALETMQSPIARVLSRGVLRRPDVA